MRYFKLFTAVLVAICTYSIGAQAQNYYIGGSSQSSNQSSRAPIYNTPSTSNRSGSGPLMLNQIIDGSYNTDTRGSGSRYSRGSTRSNQQYALGQSPDQITANRARADADERERQRVAQEKASALREQQLAQTQQYRDQVTGGTGTQDKKQVTTRTYTYNPTVKNDTVMPKRVFGSLR